MICCIFNFNFLFIVLLCQYCKNCKVIKGGLKIEGALKTTDNCCHKSYPCKKVKARQDKMIAMARKRQERHCKKFLSRSKTRMCHHFLAPHQKAKDTKSVPSYCIQSNSVSQEKWDNQNQERKNQETSWRSSCGRCQELCRDNIII